MIAIKYQNWWSWQELRTQPRLAIVTTHTIIAVMVHCYLGSNGLTCQFTRIVNIVGNAYIIWVWKTLPKYNIFSDGSGVAVLQPWQYPKCQAMKSHSWELAQTTKQLHLSVARTKLTFQNLQPSQTCSHAYMCTTLDWHWPCQWSHHEFYVDTSTHNHGSVLCQWCWQ